MSLECDNTFTDSLYFQIFNISSCEVCPGGCGSNVRIPILCPPVLGEPSCICQHPDGIINLTPYANLTGDARYAFFNMLHCNSVLAYYRIFAGSHYRMGVVLLIITILVRHFICITVGTHM